MYRKVYTVLIYFLTPLVMLRMFWRACKTPKYGRRWHERLGFVPKINTDKKVIWIHSVSVGETLAAVPLIRKIQKRYPETLLVVTTTTLTGSERVRSIFPSSIYHVYAPYDLPSAVNRFIKRTHPSLVIIMETELWPNIIHYCNEIKIPIIVANARMSEKSLKGYQKFSRFTEKMLHKVDHIVAQHNDDGENFLKLGLPQSQLTIAGNIKFDAMLDSELILKASELKAAWSGKNKRQIFLAASTHRGEDEIVLDAYKQISKSYPGLLLAIVPRHPERFIEVAKLCEEHSLVTVKRSDGLKPAKNDQVLLGDSMGELMLFYGACDVAFVGGSLIPAGGHSLIEPAIWGAPLISGPSLFNFTEVSRLLKNANGMSVCQDSASMAEVVCEILKDTVEAKRMGDAAKLVVDSNRGALDKLMKIIELQVASR